MSGASRFFRLKDSDYDTSVDALSEVESLQEGSTAENISTSDCSLNNKVAKAFSSSSSEDEENIDLIQPLKKPRIIAKISEHCLSSCSKTCRAQFEKLKFEDQDKFRTLVLGPLRERSSKLLKRFSNQRQFFGALSENSIYFEGVYYCSGFFSFITGCSKYLVRKAIHDSEIGKTDYHHGNEGIHRQSPKTVIFIAWMILYSDLYGQSSPEDLKRILPAFLCKKLVHGIYTEEVIIIYFGLVKRAMLHL